MLRRKNILDFSEVTLQCTIVVQFGDGELVWHLWSSGQEGLMGVVIRMEGHCTGYTAQVILHKLYGWRGTALVIQEHS